MLKSFRCNQDHYHGYLHNLIISLLLLIPLIMCICCNSLRWQEAHDRLCTIIAFAWTWLLGLRVDTTVCPCSLVKTRHRTLEPWWNPIFRRLLLSLLVSLCVTQNLKCISYQMKQAKHTPHVNSCVGNKEMEMNDAKIAAGGHEKKWRLSRL